MIVRHFVFLLVMLIFRHNVFADTPPPVVNTNLYDANGNLVSGDGRYYEYNDANQLARVRQGNIAGAILSEYFYDTSGQRIKKIENGVVTYYIGKNFEKQVGGVTPGTTSYYFGDDGERVAKKDPAGQIYYYHLDHLDGINAVTNSAGTAVATTDYLPFGDQRTGATGNEKYAYTGKEQDKTGLYYFDARYNSPEFRHFTQADIAEPDYDDPQDLNRYAYVGNNPLSYIDPDGFKKKKKSKKKKAKLSKREKWMIAHGSDPDHDKTSLKKAKKLFKEGKKYQLPATQASVAQQVPMFINGPMINSPQFASESASSISIDQLLSNYGYLNRKPINKYGGSDGFISDFAGELWLESETVATAIGYGLLKMGATRAGLIMTGPIGIVITSVSIGVVGEIDRINQNSLDGLLWQDARGRKPEEIINQQNLEIYPGNGTSYKLRRN